METFKKYLKHPKIWINALLGRPTPVEIPQGQVTYKPQESRLENKVQQTQPMNPDDPLHQDLQKASSVFKKITTKFTKTSAPLVAQGETVTKETLTNTSEFVKTDRFKKILPMIIFLVALLVIGILGYVGLRIYRNMAEKNQNQVTIVSTPSPTPIEQEPILPSIYATDEEVLKLEQDINVLDREVVGTQLRETTLNPPALDFNVTF